MTSRFPATILRKLADLFLLFKRPNRRQVAALVWRRGDGGNIEILLITTRRSGRWNIPKGWLMADHTAAEAAAQEAWEEAGARGVVDDTPLGEFTYEKTLSRGGPAMRMTATVFALRLTQLADDFPEAGQRERAWYTPEDAANMVRETDLRTIIRGLAS